MESMGSKKPRKRRSFTPEFKASRLPRPAEYEEQNKITSVA